MCRTLCWWVKKPFHTSQGAIYLQVREKCVHELRGQLLFNGWLNSFFFTFYLKDNAIKVINNKVILYIVHLNNEIHQCFSMFQSIYIGALNELEHTEASGKRNSNQPPFYPCDVIFYLTYLLICSLCIV